MIKKILLGILLSGLCIGSLAFASVCPTPGTIITQEVQKIKDPKPVETLWTGTIEVTTNL